MKTYKNAFELIAEPIEASLLSAKSNLMNSIVDKIKELDISQSDAAKIMKVTQPRLSNLCKGKISKFSLGILFLMNERIKND